MKKRRLVQILFLLPALALPILAQDTAGNAPDQHHTYLQAMVGTWDVAVRFWPSGAADPVEAKATAEKKMIMGGRFLQQEFKGEFMGAPFEGIGFAGYDKARKLYVSCWIDNTNTNIMRITGTDDGTGKVFTFNGESPDPATGQMNKVKEVLRVIDENKHVGEMYGYRDGKEVKELELVYTRK